MAARGPVLSTESDGRDGAIKNPPLLAGVWGARLLLLLSTIPHYPTSVNNENVSVGFFVLAAFDELACIASRFPNPETWLKERQRLILDCAAEWGADLIIVGSHGRKGIARFVLGSVSEAVARYARCSVEIVRLPTNV